VLCGVGFYSAAFPIFAKKLAILENFKNSQFWPFLRHMTLQNLEDRRFRGISQHFRPFDPT
jgi:hypothetical protein